MQTVVITGGTGLIGTALTDLLISKGYKVIILTRSVKSPKGNVSYARWDVEKMIMDVEAIATADHIIHLAGANVAGKRWTDKRKTEILESRVQSARLIVKSLTEIQNKVQTVVSASGIGWYGEDAPASKRAFVETDPAAPGFLGDTCQAWEESIKPVTDKGKRLVIFRTGIVLSRKGGAFREFLKPMQAGIAGILGSGEQVISWVHIDDICRMYLAAIENRSLVGIYNAVSPEPVTNKELVIKMAKFRRLPHITLHVPQFALKMMLGEMSVEVLKSATVSGDKIRSTGFEFLYPSVDAALNALLR